MKLSISVGVLVFILFLSSPCQNKSHFKPDLYAPLSRGEGQLTQHHRVIFSSDRYGKADGAMAFDGIDDLVVLDSDQLPDIDGPKTLSWWYWIDDLPKYKRPNGARNMVTLTHPENKSGVQIGFRGPGYKTLGLDVWEWGGKTILEVDVPETKTWIHCVYTYDGQFHRLYVNGQLSASDGVKIQGGPAEILMLGNHPKGRQWFKGKMKDFYMYRYALEGEEVLKMYRRSGRRLGPWCLKNSSN